MTFAIVNGKEIEIIGNSIGLKLLAKSLLGIADLEVEDDFHVHLDGLYEINQESKTFKISKMEMSNSQGVNTKMLQSYS